MVDEKDRLGDTLRDVKQAREDQWALEQDRKLMEQMRAHIKGGQLLCPRCHEALVERHEHGVAVMACPKAEGAWLDQAVLKHLLAKHG